MNAWIKTRRHCVRSKARRDRARIDSPFYEVADEARLVHVAHNEVMPLPVLAHLRRRRSRLLVVILAVNERRESVARVALDALPDIEHRAARRIDENAAE